MNPFALIPVQDLNSHADHYIPGKPLFNHAHGARDIFQHGVLEIHNFAAEITFNMRHPLDDGFVKTRAAGGTFVDLWQWS